MKRDQLPPWLTELEKERRRGPSDRRDHRLVVPRDRRKGFRIAKIKKNAKDC